MESHFTMHNESTKHEERIGTTKEFTNSAFILKESINSIHYRL